MSQIIEVPVTLRIEVSVPDAATAAAFATMAAEHFAHVSHAEIAAFNEANRVHPNGTGTVQSVTSTVLPVAEPK